MTTQEAKETIFKPWAFDVCEVNAAYQHLIDTGEIWQMSSAVQRDACALIAAGKLRERVE